MWGDMIDDTTVIYVPPPSCLYTYKRTIDYRRRHPRTPAPALAGRRPGSSPPRWRQSRPASRRASRPTCVAPRAPSSAPRPLPLLPRLPCLLLLLLPLPPARAALSAPAAAQRGPCSVAIVQCARARPRGATALRELASWPDLCASGIARLACGLVVVVAYSIPHEPVSSRPYTEVGSEGGGEEGYICIVSVAVAAPSGSGYMALRIGSATSVASTAVSFSRLVARARASSVSRASARSGVASFPSPSPSPSPCSTIWQHQCQ